jgi:hypothetical protein
MDRCVPERDLHLAEVILDRYNHKLECSSCLTTHTQDGTAFIRDYAGKKGDRYYRKYRCKGKSRGVCQANIGVQEFIALARRTLGAQTIDDLRRELGIPWRPPSPRRPRRRSHQPSVPSTRSPASSVQIPPTPSSSIQTPVRISKRPRSITKTGETPDRKRPHRLSIESELKEEIEHLRRELELKQSIIESLLARPTSGPPAFDRRSSPMSHVSETPPPWPDSPTPLPKRTSSQLSLTPRRPTVGPPSSFLQASRPSPLPSPSATVSSLPHSLTIPSDPPTIGQPSSPRLSESDPPIVGPSSSSDSDDEDYDLVAVAKAIGRRHATSSKSGSGFPKSSPVKVRRAVERKYDVMTIYLLGVPLMKIGQMRKWLGERRFNLDSIHNLSYVGREVLELLIDPRHAKSFRLAATSNDLSVSQEVDSSDPESCPWLANSKGIKDMARHVRKTFIARVACEGSTSNKSLVRNFYRDWASELGWADDYQAETTRLNHRPTVGPGQV